MIIEKILQLRIIVGYLGESEQFGLWTSSFFSESSDTFLIPIFQRTSLIAKVNGMTNAAALVHDKRIGLGNVYHLYRLPEETEQGLQSTLKELDQDTIGILRNKDNALEYLGKLGKLPIESNIGPILLGEISKIQHEETFEILASYYFHSFVSTEFRYPYFSG